MSESIRICKRSLKNWVAWWNSKFSHNLTFASYGNRLIWWLRTPVLVRREALGDWLLRNGEEEIERYTNCCNVCLMLLFGNQCDRIHLQSNRNETKKQPAVTIASVSSVGTGPRQRNCSTVRQMPVLAVAFCRRATCRDSHLEDSRNLSYFKRQGRIEMIDSRFQ